MKSTLNLRLITGLLLFVFVALGLAFNTGLGTTESFGWDAIAAVCPLGILETIVAGKTIAPVSVICIVITVVLLLVFGRAVCGWLCPVPVVRRIFGGKKSLAKHDSDSKEEQLPCDKSKDAAVLALIEQHRAEEKAEAGVAAADASGAASAAGTAAAADAAAGSKTAAGAAGAGAGDTDAASAGASAVTVDTSDKARRQISREFAAALRDACVTKECSACSGNATCGDEIKNVHDRTHRFKTTHFDTRYAVLAGALASAAIAGFPVFCLVCPVGLSIATFIGLWRLITMNQATWMLIVMPAILIVELVFLRKWCHRFCPMSALFSLVAKGNRTLRPTVDASRCLRLTGKAVCNKCHTACPEGIDLHDPRGLVDPSECIKCRACIDACPTDCITMPIIPKRSGVVELPLASAKETSKSSD